MKTAEIRELPIKEIAERIEDSKNLLTRMRLNHAVSPLENPMKIKFLKKDIARLNTELRKRTLTEKK